MKKNIEEINITMLKCLWTGRNKIEIERFFNLINYTKYNFEFDYDCLWLYDEEILIDVQTYIIGCKEFGIVSKVKK